MRQFLKFAPLAGAALLVAACGGSAANNTVNAPVDNGTVVDNGMAPDLNAGMPPADNGAMAGNSMNSTTTTSNTTTTNTTNAM